MAKKIANQPASAIYTRAFEIPEAPVKAKKRKERKQGKERKEKNTSAVVIDIPTLCELSLLLSLLLS